MPSNEFGSFDYCQVNCSKSLFFALLFGNKNRKSLDTNKKFSYRIVCCILLNSFDFIAMSLFCLLLLPFIQYNKEIRFNYFYCFNVLMHEITIMVLYCDHDELY